MIRYHSGFDGLNGFCPKTTGNLTHYEIGRLFNMGSNLVDGLHVILHALAQSIVSIVLCGSGYQSYVNNNCVCDPNYATTLPK